MKKKIVFKLYVLSYLLPVICHICQQPLPQTLPLLTPPNRRSRLASKNSFFFVNAKIIELQKQQNIKRYANVSNVYALRP